MCILISFFPYFFFFFFWSLFLVKSDSESFSVMSNSLQPHGLYSPWSFPGQNTGEGNLSLLQGIFLTQGLNPGVLNCRQILYQLATKEAQEDWSGQPIPSPADLPKTGIQQGLLHCRWNLYQLSYQGSTLMDMFICPADLKSH